mgnify:CR=1 FL=1
MGECLIEMEEIPISCGGRRHFIGNNEVKGHIRPRYFDQLETKLGASLNFPRPRHRKLETKS